MVPSSFQTMKFLKYYSALLLVVFSCNEFEDLNVNPNEPTTVSPGVLFTSAIRTSVQTTSNEAFLLSNNIAQLTAKTLRAEVDFYGWNAFQRFGKACMKVLPT